MLNALRASLMLLILAGTAYAGEGYNPPAPGPARTPQEPSVEETTDDGTGTPEAPAVLADAVLELLAVLPALF